jgi:hypothetical protein
VKVFLLLIGNLFFVFSVLASEVDNSNSVLNQFIEAVKDDFSKIGKGENSRVIEYGSDTSTEQNNKKGSIRTEDNFSEILYDKYIDFAKDRYINNDFVDAFFYKQKALKISKYEKVTISNPIHIGIIPDDIDRFFFAKKVLENFSSIPSVLRSNDTKYIIDDTYLAYDCWMEATEEVVTKKYSRARVCMERFIENIKALEAVLFKNNIRIDRQDFTNIAKEKCKSCELKDKGYFCNSFYFAENSIDLLSDTSIITKRIESRLLASEKPSVTIGHYNNLDTITAGRVNIIRNIIRNTVFPNIFFDPNIKTTKFTVSKSKQNEHQFNSAITVCISD